MRPAPAFFARALALSLLLLAAAPAHAQQPQRLPEEKIKKIEELITAEMSRQSIAGLSVAVVTDNQLRWSAGYGHADLENFVPARSLTVYRLGSISKPITAVAVMQLAERGKLDLDAPVQKYCPAFPAKQWPVTARQILGHLAGIRHYNSEAEFNSTRFYPSVADGLSMFKDDPLLHEPGTKYAYTTHGYSVLGCAVEGASAQKFADYVRENIFAPAGTQRLRVDSVTELIPGRAQGYRRAADGTLRNSALADNSYKVPGGGFVSTVEDLARFAVAVQTAKLTKPETLAQMFTRQQTKDGAEAPYGLGWSVATIDGQRAVGHSGAQQRVSTFLHMLPDRGFAVAVMVNVEDTRLQPLVMAITDAVLK
ncbi:MAG: beta-lactamase family protein [Acidobacteria bacterium]|nr:beta-lactamase family protein [Acidobacteriota bacterium]